MNTDRQPIAVIVNDDPVQLRLTASVVRKEGLRVFPFLGVEEALQFINQRHQVDIIITDLHMPSIDGWQFCRLLRSPDYPRLNSVPILVTSATFSGTDAEQITVDLRANAFLASPYKASVLQTVVRQLLVGEKPHPTASLLIVEDSSAQTAPIRHEFERCGYLVHIATTGEQAKRLFHQHTPEIVILDYNLPDMTGDQLLPDIKRPGSQTVAIIITSDESPECALHCIRQGADGYVRKPLEPAYLVDLSEKARRQRALLRVEEILEVRTQELERERADFLAMLSHDIKSPLGVILGCTEILMEEATERASTEELNFLERLQSNAMLVHSLVSNYLDYTRSEAGYLTLNKRRFDLNALLLGISQRYEADARRRRIMQILHLTPDLPSVEGDPLALERVFSNLLHNALKFTPEHGSVTIATAQRQGGITITITDTGCGIADEEIPLLFQRFRRAEATRHREGTGLGLFIVKALVEAHIGGRIEVASTVGKGSCFTVFLPLSSTPQHSLDVKNL